MEDMYKYWTDEYRSNKEDEYQRLVEENKDLKKELDAIKAVFPDFLYADKYADLIAVQRIIDKKLIYIPKLEGDFSKIIKYNNEFYEVIK